MEGRVEISILSHVDVRLNIFAAGCSTCLRKLEEGRLSP